MVPPLAVILTTSLSIGFSFSFARFSSLVFEWFNPLPLPSNLAFTLIRFCVSGVWPSSSCRHRHYCCYIMPWASGFPKRRSCISRRESRAARNVKQGVLLTAIIWWLLTQWGRVALSGGWASLTDPRSGRSTLWAMVASVYATANEGHAADSAKMRKRKKKLNYCIWLPTGLTYVQSRHDSAAAISRHVLMRREAGNATTFEAVGWVTATFLSVKALLAQRQRQQKQIKNCRSVARSTADEERIALFWKISLGLRRHRETMKSHSLRE